MAGAIAAARITPLCAQKAGLPRRQAKTLYITHACHQWTGKKLPKANANLPTCQVKILNRLTCQRKLPAKCAAASFFASERRGGAPECGYQRAAARAVCHTAAAVACTGGVCRRFKRLSCRICQNEDIFGRDQALLRTQAELLQLPGCAVCMPARLAAGKELASGEVRLPLYTLGFLFAFGAVLGRFVCGWLCPFGLVQDLIYKIPAPKKLRRLPGDRGLVMLRYLLLALLCILLPLTVSKHRGAGKSVVLQGGLPGRHARGGAAACVV